MLPLQNEGGRLALELRINTAALPWIFLEFKRGTSAIILLVWAFEEALALLSEKKQRGSWLDTVPSALNCHTSISVSVSKGCCVTLHINSTEPWFSLRVLSFGVFFVFLSPVCGFYYSSMVFQEYFAHNLSQLCAFACLKHLTCPLKTENDCKIAKNLFPWNFRD